VSIVIHAARATHDWLGSGVPRGGRIYHVLSDRDGAEGSHELRAFIQQLGLQTRWVQFPGAYREHFDAPGRYGEILLAHGARPVTTRELGELLKRKRSAERQS
jgi:hypothetical protein